MPSVRGQGYHFLWRDTFSNSGDAERAGGGCEVKKWDTISNVEGYLE